MTHLLYALLARLHAHLPRNPARKRPYELLYAADDCPPAGTLGLLSVQHAATVLALITHALAAAKIAGLPLDQTHSLVAMTLVGMALGTALQAWGGRWGSGTLLVFQPDPMMITIAGAAIASHGLGALVPVSLTAAAVTFGIGPLMRHLRPLFPPTVVGVVICMGGIGLVSPAVHNVLGWDAQRGVDGPSVLIASAALACIVGCSVWGRGRWRLMGLLSGIGVGLALALACGRLSGGAELDSAPWLALPQPIAPSFSISPEILLAVVLIAALNQLDNIGCLIVMERTDDADWRRADLQRVGRGIRANGASDFLTGLFGSFPTAPSSANIALVHATGASARMIGLGAAALLLLLALSPRFTLALTLIPHAVLGAVELYAAAYLMVSGIEMIASRALDARGQFMVGLSLSAGLAVHLMPELAQGLPPSLRLLLGDGFVVAGLTVVGLNLLFRLGTQQSAQQLIDPMGGPLHEQLTRFVEQQGKAWSARTDVVRRAAHAVLEASEALAASGRGRPVSIRGSFDEFRLDLELLHEGAPLSLAAPAALHSADLEALLDAPDGELEAQLEATMHQVSQALIRQLADKVSSQAAADGHAVLKLHFEH